MKKVLLVALLTVSLATVLGVSRVNALSIGFTGLDSPNFTVGNPFSVGVMVYGEDVTEELLAFGFNVSVTGTAFEYTGYAIGANFDPLADPSNPMFVSGLAFPGLTGNVLLANLLFKGLSTGSGGFSITGHVDSTLLYGLYYQTLEFSIGVTSNSITISDSPAPVPEPATLLLLGSGLAGLGLMRKRLRTA